MWVYRLVIVLAVWCTISCNKTIETDDIDVPHDSTQFIASKMRLTLSRTDNQILSSFDFNYEKSGTTFIIRRMDSIYHYHNDQLFTAPHPYYNEFKFVFDASAQKLLKVIGKHVYLESISPLTIGHFFEIKQTYCNQQIYPREQSITFFSDSNMTEIKRSETFFNWGDDPRCFSPDWPLRVYTNDAGSYYGIYMNTDTVRINDGIPLGSSFSTNTQWLLTLRNQNFTFGAETESLFHFNEDSLIDRSVATNVDHYSEWTDERPPVLVSKKKIRAERKRYLNQNKEIAMLLTPFFIPGNWGIKATLSMYQEYFRVNLFSDALLVDEFTLSTNSTVDSIFYTQNESPTLLYRHETQSHITRDREGRISYIDITENPYAEVRIRMNFFYD